MIEGSCFDHAPSHRRAFRPLQRHLARLALTLAVLLTALGMAAWILHAALPTWVCVCVWPDALILIPLLFLRTLTPRTDPRLAPRP